MTMTQSNANAYSQQVAEFNRQTRNRNYKLPSQQRSASNLLLRFDLPPSYLVGRIKIEVRGVTSATAVTGPNADGWASLIKNIRVQSNMGDDLVNISGRQYFGAFAPVADLPGNTIPHATLGAVAASTTVILPVVIPFAVNLRDATGLLPLQNRQTVATLWVEFNTDAVVATTIGWTTQPIVNVTVEVFSIPFMPSAQPPISMIHRIIGFTQAVSAVGDVPHVWDRGNIVLQKMHMLGWAGGGTNRDNWSRVRLLIQQTDNMYVYENILDANDTVIANDQDTYFAYQRLGQRNKGVIYFDFVGQSGLGIYDIPRDAMDMRRYTDVMSLISVPARNSGGVITFPFTVDHVTRYLQPLS